MSVRLFVCLCVSLLVLDYMQAKLSSLVWRIFTKERRKGFKAEIAASTSANCNTRYQVSCPHYASVVCFAADTQFLLYLYHLVLASTQNFIQKPYLNLPFFTFFFPKFCFLILPQSLFFFHFIYNTILFAFHFFCHLLSIFCFYFNYLLYKYALSKVSDIDFCKMMTEFDIEVSFVHV